MKSGRVNCKVALPAVLAAAAFCLCALPAAAQNLLVSNMNVFFRNGGGGYCNDVDASNIVPISQNSFSNYFSTASLPGFRVNETLNTTNGACTTSSVSIDLYRTFSDYFSGSTPPGITGTLTGGDGWANGNVSGSIYGMPSSFDGSAGFLYCIPRVTGDTYDDFSSGGLGEVGWQTFGAQNWSAAGGSAASGNIGASQYSALAVAMNATAAGSVSFWFTISSEEDYDYLRFYIDNVEQAAWSGEINWTFASFGVGAGFHEFRWVYSKDGSVNSGSDKAWIDNVSFPANNPVYNGTTLLSTVTIPSTFVYGFEDSGSGQVVAPVIVEDEQSNLLICTSERTVCRQSGSRWFANNTTGVRVYGDVNGTVSGPPSGPDTKVSFYSALTGNVWNDAASIQFERPKTTYPGACLGLCASIACAVTTGPITFGIDDLTFEIFRFGPGTNPLDPSSSPPIKTVSVFSVTSVCNVTAEDVRLGRTRKTLGTHCTAWDGSYNLNGLFGKQNGQFGFRAKVTTRQTTPQGTSVDIEQTAAYPGQNQLPIQTDVVNIHMVRSSATAVGGVTKVPAQPYNIRYQLTKDATATINIFDSDATHAAVPGIMPLVRTIISSQARVGEGADPAVPMANGDFWDGRDENGAVLPAGSYLARIEAGGNDYWGEDMAYPATVQMTLDPLQITDIGVKALGAASTDMAVISYILTEAATVYVDIYTPGTQFVDVNTSPPVVSGTTGSLLRRYVEQKDGRRTVSNYWDGRDANGNPLCDGDYVYAIYAEFPSVGGYPGHSWTSVKTRRTSVGLVPVVRGPVLAFLTPSSTVIGSTPPAAGLNPFYFRYTPSRDTSVSLNIRDSDGTPIRRRVVTNEQRFANIQNTEAWDGKWDDGTYASSGTYLAELITDDPFVCAAAKISTMTALIPVDLFRVVDVRSTPLLGSASSQASFSFELSQTMFVNFNIYNVDQTVNPSVWPPSGLGTPVYTVQGMRPGRMRINEYWDGRDTNGLLVPDGRYPYTLVAHSSGTAQVMYATDKVYGYMDVARGQVIFNDFDVYPTIPTLYNSGEVVQLPPYGIEYSLLRQSSVTVEVVTLDLQPRLMASITDGEVREGETLYKDFWDGKCTNTADCPHTDYVPSGSYNIRVVAEDIAAQLSSRATVQKTIDIYPLRIYDLAITPLTLDGMAVVSYQVSEPMKVVTKVYKPGTSLTGPSDPVNSLVKRIIGVRPARTQISEYWDGTDLTLSKVPDGNYVFKIYASTVTAAINSSDGSVVPGTTLADDILTANIPVTRSGTNDLCGDFTNESFFAPNPYTGEGGWFKIPALINGTIAYRIYNLAGEQVYKRDYGVRAAGNNVDGTGRCAVTHTHEACWPKVNNSGRTVAPGVYFAVIRFEATEGTRDVCQVVKKILVP